MIQGNLDKNSNVDIENNQFQETESTQDGKGLKKAKDTSIQDHLDKNSYVDIENN